MVIYQMRLSVIVPKQMNGYLSNASKCYVQMVFIGLMWGTNLKKDLPPLATSTFEVYKCIFQTPYKESIIKDR